MGFPPPRLFFPRSFDYCIFLNFISPRFWPRRGRRFSLGSFFFRLGKLYLLPLLLNSCGFLSGDVHDNIPDHLLFFPRSLL